MSIALFIATFVLSAWQLIALRDLRKLIKSDAES
jgi:cytochrome oxidase assembly protein ShyY1